MTPLTEGSEKTTRNWDTRVKDITLLDLTTQQRSKLIKIAKFILNQQERERKTTRSNFKKKYVPFDCNAMPTNNCTDVEARSFRSRVTREQRINEQNY